MSSSHNWTDMRTIMRTIRAYWSKRRVVPPVLFRTNYYSIEILHGVTAIILTYHPHHAKLQVLPRHVQCPPPPPSPPIECWREWNSSLVPWRNACTKYYFKTADMWATPYQNFQLISNWIFKLEPIWYCSHWHELAQTDWSMNQARDTNLRHSDWFKSASRVAQNSWWTAGTYALFWFW